MDYRMHAIQIKPGEKQSYPAPEGISPLLYQRPEKLRIYQTDSDTLLISRENSATFNQRAETPGLKSAPLLDNIKDEPMDEIPSSASSITSQLNGGFQDVDEELSDLTKFMNFKVGSIVPCLSSTDLEVYG